MSMKALLMMDNIQNSMDNKLQILHRTEWETNKWGGKVGKPKPYEKGEDLVRLAELNEIVPGIEKYYIRPNGMGHDYYLLYKGFHKTVEYSGIKSMVNAKSIYVNKDFKL